MSRCRSVYHSSIWKPILDDFMKFSNFPSNKETKAGPARLLDRWLLFMFTDSSIFAKHQFRWCGQYLVTILKRFLLCLKRLCSRTLWQWGHKKNSKSYHPVLASLWAATEKPKSVEAGRRYSTWVLRSILKHCTTPMAIHSKALKIKVFILLAFLMDTVHKIKKWLH